MPLNPISVPGASLDSIAEGINELISQANSASTQAPSSSAISNPFPFSQLPSFLQAKGWEVQTNLNINPPTITFLFEAFNGVWTPVPGASNIPLNLSA